MRVTSRIPIEQVKQAPVAVDVAFRHLPVVDAGVPRGTGIGQDEPALEFGRIDVECHPTDPVDTKLDRRDPAVVGGSEVLGTGGHIDRLSFDVHGDLEQVVRREGAALPPGHGPHTGRRSWRTSRQCRRQPVNRFG